jgi:hypothetical protein
MRRDHDGPGSVERRGAGGSGASPASPIDPRPHLAKAVSAADASLMKNLTPSKINQIAFAARDGTVDPDDVLAALTLFHRCAFAREQIPRRLIDYVAESFGRLLGLKDYYGSGERSAKTLDAAFGLLRKRGRPGADEQTGIQIAAEVVRLRVSGLSHQDAVADAVETFGWEKTIVEKAFRDYRMSGIVLYRTKHSAVTNDEARRLEKIVTPRYPRKSRIKPR